MRKAFIQQLVKCAEADPSVSLLMAEVGFSVVEPFQEKFPERFFNTGIAEMNMVATAAGMAIDGMRPVCYSMSCFLPSRAFEIIKVSVAYQDLPVVLVSQGSGLSYSMLGSTHHAIEEANLMKTLPNMTVEFPADGRELQQTLSYALSQDHPFYISLPKLPDIPATRGDYAPGKMTCLKKGRDDIVLLAIGYELHHALTAADLLEKEGISPSVWALHSVKPLDPDALAAICAGKHVFVAEEHENFGDTASDIAKILLMSDTKVQSYHDIAIPDTFVKQVTAYPELLEQYNLAPEKLADIIRKAVNPS